MTSDDELEALRRKRLAELQMQMESEQQAEARRRNAEMAAQRQAVLRAVLLPEARERLAALRMTRPELVAEVEQQLFILAQQGRINRQIDDATLKDLLSRLMPRKREINIERR